MLLPRLQNIPPPPRLAALVLIAAVGARLLLREEEGPRWVRGLMSPDMVHAALNVVSMRTEREGSEQKRY